MSCIPKAKWFVGQLLCVSISGHIALMVGWLVSDKLERNWKEVIMA
jgi:hypothetical protein